MLIDHANLDKTCYGEALGMEGLLAKPSKLVFTERLKLAIAERIESAAHVGKTLEEQDIAKDLKVSKGALSKWKLGQTKPGYSTLDQMAKYFDKPVSWFFLDAEDPLPDLDPLSAAEIVMAYISSTKSPKK